MKPKNFAEGIIWYSIIGTYGFYLIGGLYILGPAIAWILLFYLCQKLWKQTDTVPQAEKIFIPWVIWVWIGGMLIQEVALIMGHLDFNLGTNLLIKSSTGWAKGWAMLAIFPLIGCLKIRPQLLYRAVCIVCFHSLLLAPILYLAYVVHLPGLLYISPLKVFGGAGDLFFEVRLYLADEEGVRLSFFGPWAPATGMVGNIYFFMALQEKNQKWRWCGIVGSLLLCYMSKSRMATLCLLVVLITTWGLTKLTRPLFLITLGLGSTFAGIAAPLILDTTAAYWDNFRASRAESTRVREALQRIALERWGEAPVWGHGTVERGPKLVEHMPIGSHHTIFALLFVKGLVGVIAFAVPIVCSFVDLLVKVQKSETARVGLSIILIFYFYSFGKNLEIIAYLFWPGLVILGIAFKEKKLTHHSWPLNHKLNIT